MSVYGPNRDKNDVTVVMSFRHYGPVFSDLALCFFRESKDMLFLDLIHNLANVLLFIFVYKKDYKLNMCNSQICWLIVMIHHSHSLE